MLGTLAVTLPFFALVLCGFVATWRGVLPLSAIGGLNSYVLYFALPCMLFQFGAHTPLAQLLDLPLFVTYTLSAAVVVGLALAISRRAWRRSPQLNWNDSAFGALVAAFPNTGFMGVPLLVALLGSASAGPVMVAITVDMILTSSLCLALSRLDQPSDGQAAGLGALRRSLHRIAANPMPWAIALGALFSAQQWQWPGPVARTVEMLSTSASPVALFTIGAVLARSQHMAQHDANHRVNWHTVWPVALMKLALHPLLMLGVIAALRPFGLTPDAAGSLVLVLVAALPSASNVSLLAERMGADNGRIARIILLTTATAFFSFPVWVALLR